MMIHETLLCALELQVLVCLDLCPLVVPKLSHPSEIHAMVMDMSCSGFGNREMVFGCHVSCPLQSGERRRWDIGGLD